MKKLVVLLGSLLMLLALVAPALAAEPTLPETGRVLISIEDDVTLPAGDHADAVIVVNGDAAVAGTARTVLVIGGTATIQGAIVETLTVIDGGAVLEAGTTIRGDVVQLNSTVEQAEGVVISGTVRSLAQDLAGFALFLGFAAVVFWIGGLLAALVAGLALAGFAARQVRTAEAVISREPVKAFLVGLAMIVLPPILLIVLAATIVGLPLALSILFFAWPTVAFVGFLIGAIWIGEWLLRTTSRPAAERPYLATLVGLVIAGLLSFIPLVGAIVSLFGVGAVTVAGWRTLTGPAGPRPTLQPHPAPGVG